MKTRSSEQDKYERGNWDWDPVQTAKTGGDKQKKRLLQEPVNLEGKWRSNGLPDKRQRHSEGGNSEMGGQGTTRTNQQSR